MIKRITITIEENLDEKIRDIQVKKISESRKSVSYSQVVNELVKHAIECGESQFSRQYA